MTEALAVAIIVVVALLVAWIVTRKPSICVCYDSDNCVCGGAAGRPRR